MLGGGGRAGAFRAGQVHARGKEVGIMPTLVAMLIVGFSAIMPPQVAVMLAWQAWVLWIVLGGR